MKKLRRKARLFGLPYRLFEMLFPFIFLHGTACMKQRFFGAQGAEGFSLPAPLTSFLDRERKRFLAFARNDECGEAAFSYRKPSSCGAREAAFSLLPMEGGAPKGRRLASQRTESRAGGALSRIVIPSAAEGSFSFAVFSFLRGTVCMKHRFGRRREYGVSRLPFLSHPLSCRERKRFLAFARNDECWEAAFSYRKPSV